MRQEEAAAQATAEDEKDVEMQLGALMARCRLTVRAKHRVGWPCAETPSIGSGGIKQAPLQAPPSPQFQPAATARLLRPALVRATSDNDNDSECVQPPRKKLKKGVTWKPDEELCQIQYFTSEPSSSASDLAAADAPRAFVAPAATAAFSLAPSLKPSQSFFAPPGARFVV